ncbi:pentatricopeptide repeat domain-containing [Pyrenophora seminiperda CCB06]|uniref:Pentatricopeptide repeat domain-containing n=1 Tax=Pyrenophora seminiperda CCB06 TaxID=1302712 RepID=A0A3M7LUG5_9PLEO|nr:pentatricopeptide repeat domain-containing [Pyrenophora seminiperda CCB06]
MPLALDRLLASPTALQLLRSLINGSELPAASATATICCHAQAIRRRYSGLGANQPKLNQNLEWKRLRDAAKAISIRNRVREALLNDDANDAVEPTVDSFESSPIRVAKRKDDPAQLAATLAYEERLYQGKGVRNFWQTMRHRKYRLPSEDTPDAEFLWGTLIKNHLLVPKVIEHAEELLRETGKTYPRLYELVMSYYLAQRPRQALRYHYLMVRSLKLKTFPLRHLARAGRSTFKPAAYEALLEIYGQSDERDIYDEVVLALVEKGHVTAARQWHAICTMLGDKPSELVASHPVISLFAHVEITPNEVRSEPKLLAKPHQPDTSRFNQNLIRRLAGPDTAPVRFEDSFVARMFATKTFSPTSVIQGLAMVGVNEIGPQAVLTMAAQTKPIEELPKRFEELRAAGIALQGCVFSLALEKFAMEQKWHLVRSIIESDQHPDVFGDEKVQRTLLEYYLEQGDQLQAQRTLAILTLFHNDSSQESWNLLLQVNVQRSGSQHVMEVIDGMRIRGVMLHSESVVTIKSLLSPRRQGHRPAINSFDELRFVARVFITILESGLAPIPTHYWRELVRRYGMLMRLRELRRLLLWLLCWYAPRGSIQFTNLPRSPFLEPATAKLRTAYPERHHYFQFPAMVAQSEHARHPIRTLFPPSLIQGLIVWGFRAGLLPNADLEQHMLGSPFAKKHYRRRLLRQGNLNRLEWTIGLRTVVQLRDLGVWVHRHTVLKALQAQFVVLFGHRRSNIVENRIMEGVNTLPYAHYVREVNRIWGTPLLREPQLFRSHMVHGQTWHPRLRRRRKRRKIISLGEMLGPDWHGRDGEGDTSPWARAVSELDANVFDQLKKRFESEAEAAGSDGGRKLKFSIP